MHGFLDASDNLAKKTCRLAVGLAAGNGYRGAGSPDHGGVIRHQTQVMHRRQDMSIQCERPAA
jgi:hypothetical protein